MAEDDLQGRDFQQPGPPDLGVSAGGAAAISIILGNIASGVAIRANELLELADSAGTVNIEIDSTCIRILTYNIRTGALAITFTDGSVYPYPPVNMFNFLRFLNADSRGSFYNKYVRGQWG